MRHLLILLVTFSTAVLCIPVSPVKIPTRVSIDLSALDIDECMPADSSCLTPSTLAESNPHFELQANLSAAFKTLHYTRKNLIFSMYTREKRVINIRAPADTFMHTFPDPQDVEKAIREMLRDIELDMANIDEEVATLNANNVTRSTIAILSFLEYYADRVGIAVQFLDLLGERESDLIGIERSISEKRLPLRQHSQLPIRSNSHPQLRPSKSSSLTSLFKSPSTPSMQSQRSTMRLHAMRDDLLVSMSGYYSESRFFWVKQMNKFRDGLCSYVLGAVTMARALECDQKEIRERIRIYELVRENGKLRAMSATTSYIEEFDESEEEPDLLLMDY